MILGHEKIVEYVRKYNLIENFDKNCLSCSGYDLRIGKIYRISGSCFLRKADRKLPEIEEIPEERYSLARGEYLLLESLEKVNMPKNLAARILPRSTVFRCGASLITALVDPGYQGTLTMGLVNLGSEKFEIEKGSRIAQIIFEEILGEAKPYSGRYQGGKVI